MIACRAAHQGARSKITSGSKNQRDVAKHGSPAEAGTTQTRLAFGYLNVIPDSTANGRGPTLD